MLLHKLNKLTAKIIFKIFFLANFPFFFSQVGFLESALLGVLPSAMLSRYLSRLRLGGSLNNPDTLMSTVGPFSSSHDSDGTT